MDGRFLLGGRQGSEKLTLWVLACLFLLVSIDFIFDSLGQHMVFIESGNVWRAWSMPQSDTFRVSAGGFPSFFNPLLFLTYKAGGLGTLVYLMWIMQCVGLAIFAHQYGGKTWKGVAQWGLAAFILWPFFSLLTLITWVAACFPWIGVWMENLRSGKDRVRSFFWLFFLASQLPLNWIAMAASWINVKKKWFFVFGGVGLVGLLFFPTNRSGVYLWWIKSFGGFYTESFGIVAIPLSVAGTLLCIKALSVSSRKIWPLVCVSLLLGVFFFIEYQQLGSAPLSAIHKIGFSSLVILAIVIQAPLRRGWKALRWGWLFVCALMMFLAQVELPVPSWRNISKVTQTQHGFVVMKQDGSTFSSVPFYSFPTKNEGCVLVMSPSASLLSTPGWVSSKEVVSRRIESSCFAAVTQPLLSEKFNPSNEQ